jgi:acyl dehydratase
MARTFEQVKEGDEVPAFVVENLTRTDLVKYAGASGDFNPIHHDEGFSKVAGNPTVFGHGMLTAGFVGKCVTDFVGAENLRKFKVRFATRVWPGDTITCKGRVTKKYDEAGEHRIDGEVAALNQKGEVAVSGTFTAALPARA